jgi:hypothetical protein
MAAPRENILSDVFFSIQQPFLPNKSEADHS